MSSCLQVFEIKSESELSQVVKAVEKLLENRDIVLLKGPMGVGKTQFVKCWVSGSKAEVSSPTFSLHNEYNLEPKIIDHFDLYRVESEDDLESVGIWDLFERPEGLVFIEWPERIPRGHLPSDWNIIELDFEFVGKSQQNRKVSVRKISAK